VFFLAIEYSRVVQIASFEGVLMATTILMILVLPYFLPSNFSTLGFSEWLAGRAVIGMAGLAVGYGLRQSVGSLIPASVGYLPMTFLILTAMTSCYLQFYGLMRLRLAK
jgi:hypothetical protein